MYAKQFFLQLSSPSALYNILTLTPQIRSFSRTPFPNEISHYLHRAKIIDSIRIALRSNPPTSLLPLLSTPTLDSFIVTNALRSAPSPNSALSLIETLKEIPSFSHTQTTLFALAKILAKTQKSSELKALINDINGGKFTNASVSFMDLMRWHAIANDLDSVLHVWDLYKASSTHVCTESYNIVMDLYARKGKNLEAVQAFNKAIKEGIIPNSRTYTIIIEHLLSSGKWDSAMEVFNTLPLLRIKRTLRQYSVLIDNFSLVERFDVVKAILNEMKKDGVLPGRAMRVSLQKMKNAGFIEETDEFIEEMLPDERISNISYCVDKSDDEENDDDDVDNADMDTVQLKPWLDPRALASALRNWSNDEVAALENSNIVWTSRLVCKILRNFKSPKTAWDFFCWVAYQPEFNHDIYTIQRMIALLARHGNVVQVDKLLSKVKKEGIKLPFSSVRLIIEFYGMSKNADAALSVFEKHKTLCGPVSNFNLMLLYTSLLRTLTKCKKTTETLNILDEMIICGINPDTQTYSGLMNYFASQGDIRTVQRLFTMVRQSGVGPDAFMFKVLIEAYCKCERAVLAWRVFEDMRNCDMLPDGETKKLLVRSLWNEGKRREAAAVEESCEEIKDVFPLALRGHIWTVSSSDLTRIFTIYSDSFISSNS